MGYLFMALVLLVVELLYFKIADKYNIIDKPNMRGSSTRITLRGGGIIFPISVLLYYALCGMYNPWFVAGLMLISGVSFLDDLKGVPSIIRLLCHMFAVFAVFVQWSQIIGNDADRLHIFSGSVAVVWAIFGLVLCAGIINAFNFMDGINGITSGYALTVLIPLVVLNGHSLLGLVPPDQYASGLHDRTGVPAGFVYQDLLIVFGMGLIIFSFFNFRKKAVAFAGDVGSISVAFILLFVIGQLIIRTGNIWWLMLMCVYGVDTGCTIVHRIMLGERLSVAHRKHMFQIMANELHMPHVVVSLIYMTVQLLISAGLILLPFNQWIYSAVVLVVLVAIYVLFMKKYYHLHEEYLASVAEKSKEKE